MLINTQGDFCLLRQVQPNGARDKRSGERLEKPSITRTKYLLVNREATAHTPKG